MVKPHIPSLIYSTSIGNSELCPSVEKAVVMTIATLRKDYDMMMGQQ